MLSVYWLPTKTLHELGHAAKTYYTGLLFYTTDSAHKINNKASENTEASHIQGDSLKRGPEYSVLTVARMNQSERNKVQ